MEVLDGIRCLSHFHIVAFHVVFFMNRKFSRDEYYKLFYSNEFSFVMHGSIAMNYFFLITGTHLRIAFFVLFIGDSIEKLKIIIWWSKGFLITTILLNQKKQGKHIQWISFVLRRVTKLFPPLAAGVAIFWMIPKSYIESHNMCDNVDTWRVLLFAEPIQAILPVEYKVRL
jgi:peptidoglycan/LPS O-acetylase OafA/YrhL